MICAGLDVGRFHDRTALAVLEGERLTSAHRLPSLPFAEQAAILAPLLARCDVVAVDVTGLGLGLYELLEGQGLPVVPVTLGTWSSPDFVRGGLWTRVGKSWLIGRVKYEVDNRRLSVAPDCKDRQELMRELGNLAARYSKQGRISIAARKGHDDLALALALAILARDYAPDYLNRGLHRDQAQGQERGQAVA